MNKPPSWTINAESLSHQQLVAILKGLADTPHTDIIQNLRKELIRRLRVRRIDTPEIIRRLSFAVPRGRKLNDLANDWAETLEITVEEFKRIADAK